MAHAPRARQRFRPRIEPLEGRWLPSTLTFTAPTGNGLDTMVLRRNGNKVEILDNGLVKDSKPLAGLTSATITGASGENDTLTVDFSFGGLFSLPGGIAFNNAPAVAGTDTLIVKATTAANTIVMNAANLTVDGSLITFTGIEKLQVNTLGGGDTVTLKGLDPSVDTTVDASGGTGPNRFNLNVSGNFTGNLSTLHFDQAFGNVTGDFSGHWNVHGSGTIDSLSIGGSLTSSGSVMSEDITTIMVMGNVSGAVVASGSGTIGTMTVDGSITTTGSVSSEDITTIMVMGDVAGTIMAIVPTGAGGTGTIGTLDVGGSITSTGTVMAKTLDTGTVTGNVNGDILIHGSGTIGALTIGGSIGSSGSVMAEDITTIMVMGSVSGSVVASGSGTIGTMTVDGSITSTGTVSSEDITTIMVMGDVAGAVTVTSNGPGQGDLTTMTVGSNLTGTVSVQNNLNSLAITGSSTGTITTGTVGTVSATGAVAGSPVLTITQGGVQRTLEAKRVDNGDPTPSSVKFVYFYNGALAVPQVSVRVTNGSSTTSSDDVRFDLSLITSDAGKFNLGLLYANGTSGIRDLAVEGDIVPSVDPQALAFLGLTPGTPGGVKLPLDKLGCVAAQGNVTAGTVQLATIQAVAFGSITANGVTTLAQSATHVDAAGLLAPGSTPVLANDTYQVPFAEGQPVSFWLNTGPGDFDVKDVLFTDQSVDNQADNKSVTATVTAMNGVITKIVFTGDGGSISTSQPITQSITSTGPLGDLILSSSTGVGNVTAPRIFGNIDTKGPFFGIVQTTVGDLGSPIRNTSGTIIGTTFINTTQGISGKIISRGSLISQVSSQKEITGVLAAQGDLGVAYVNGAGQLVRFGGLLSNGQFSGDLVILGNALGDIQLKNGLSGRIAVKGRTIVGLASSRIGILGNFLVSGNIASTAAIVSAGRIGDLAGGTIFSSGAIKGILAAEGGINFGGIGNTSGATIIPNATGQNKTTIDAIFTNGGAPLAFDLTPGSLLLDGLTLILTDLNDNLKVVNGGLTGTVP
jgi:hypothetical protein